MQPWTWNKLEQEFAKYPEQKKAFDNHPPKGDCATFEEVIPIDDMQCDIVAVVIGCQCAASMKAQQREAMAIRKTIWRTPREWIAASETGQLPEYYDEQLRSIIERYAQQSLCHRNWLGEQAGIRCYCDEHNHS